MKNKSKPLKMMLPAAAHTFIVRNTNNDGPASLRHMINAANVRAGQDTIAFNIPGVGVQTIAVTSSLPEITDPVIIDGYTQPGSAANTLKVGDNAKLLIVLNGANAPSSVGLSISAGRSVVRGLVINNFLPEYENWGIGIFITGKGGNRIEGCFIGTDHTGSVAAYNQIGVAIVASPNNIVGGVAARSRNVISGNFNAGIRIYDFFDSDQGDGNQVRGNYIGTDAQGQKRLSQFTEFGIALNGVSNTTIGGTVAGACNVISGNSDGILITGGASTTPIGNKVEGNYIGVDATGTKAVGNYNGINYQALGMNNMIGGTADGARNVISGNGVGIYLITGTLNSQTKLKIQGNYIGSDVTGATALGNTDSGIFIDSASMNLIGGTEPGAANLIAFNGKGIGVLGRNGVGINNAILSNSIHSNNSLGIDLLDIGPTPNDAKDSDIGANNLQNYPVLSTASTTSSGTTVQARLQSTPNTTFTIQFFANSACDPSGYGEGERFIGSKTVTTGADGKVRFSAHLPPVPAGQFITATATDPDGNTSEFSACATVIESLSTAGL